MRERISTDEAPRAVGPYSQAIRAGGFLWVSGQIALDPRSGSLVQESIEAETRQVLRNLAAVLSAGGSATGKVVRATVWLVDMKDFESVNRIYGEFFPTDPPARVTIEVRALPRGARVEIDAVAL